MLRDVCLDQTSLLLIGQKGLAHFLEVSALASHWRRIVQILCQRRRKTTNTAPTTISVIQAALQTNSLLLMHNYTPFAISRNDKNKQLALLNQRKLAFTVRNTLCAL
jgi:hypothetical protein